MYRGRICITIINNRDFYVHQGISSKECIGISILLIRCCSPPPACDTQPPFDILFITMFYTRLVTKDVYHRGGGAASYKKIEIPIYSFKEMP